MVRPEDVVVRALPDPSERRMPTLVGIVTSYSFLGRTVRLEVALTNGTVCTVALPKADALREELAVGSRVSLEIAACHAFLQRNGSDPQATQEDQEAVSGAYGETERDTANNPLAMGQE